MHNSLSDELAPVTILVARSTEVQAMDMPAADALSENDILDPRSVDSDTQ